MNQQIDANAFMAVVQQRLANAQADALMQAALAETYRVRLAASEARIAELTAPPAAEATADHQAE